MLLAVTILHAYTTVQDFGNTGNRVDTVVAAASAANNNNRNKKINCKSGGERRSRAA